jgi:hypothetical protein
MPSAGFLAFLLSIISAHRALEKLDLMDRRPEAKRAGANLPHRGRSEEKYLKLKG